MDYEDEVKNCMEYGGPEWLEKSIQTYLDGKDSSIWEGEL